MADIPCLCFLIIFIFIFIFVQLNLHLFLLLYLCSALSLSLLFCVCFQEESLYCSSLSHHATCAHTTLLQLFRFGNTSWYITAMSESFLYPIIFTIFNILVSQFNFTSIGMVLFPGWCLRAGGALFQTVPPHLRPHRVPQPSHPSFWLPDTSGWFIIGGGKFDLQLSRFVCQSVPQRTSLHWQLWRMAWKEVKSKKRSNPSAGIFSNSCDFQFFITL